MKRTLKIAAIFLTLMVVAGAITIYAVLHLITDLIKGDEVFDTTTEEVEAFNQAHLTDGSALDQHFVELANQTGSAYTITERQINRDESFNESTYIKDEGGLDTQRQVYVSVTYRINVPESRPYTLCETCDYTANATYEYENEEYRLDTVKFEHDVLASLLEQTLAPEYVEPNSIPDSPYYYQITWNGSDGQIALQFNELSDTGYWDKDSDGYMLTTPLFSNIAQLQDGIIAGEVYSYAAKESATGFLQINDDGTLSLYKLPKANPYNFVDSSNLADAELIKTFIKSRSDSE